MSPELRIIAGEYKGKRLKSFAGEYRPTAAVVKKSVFDIIGLDIEDSGFLDMFAGCGAVGIEALSRGAGKVYFIENDPYRINALHKNLQMLGVEKSLYRVIGAGYNHALDSLGKERLKFDFIYVDPPYQKLNSRRVLGEITDSRILAENGLIIYEAGRLEVKEILLSTPPEMYPVREKTHGSTAVIFFRWSNQAQIKSSADADTGEI